MHPSISAQHLLHRPDLPLLDIRPPEERADELGFIPGSLSVPASSEDVSAFWRVSDLLCAAPAAVVVCLSGRRAQRLLDAHPSFAGTPLLFLDGGLLGWQAADLPLASLHDASDEPLPHFSSPQAMFRALGSCFAAELPDPMALLHACFEAEGVDPQRPALHRVPFVLDRAALHSRRTGTSLDRIARNLAHAYAGLRSLQTHDDLHAR
jgi:rhodanese-related sulfurtransferase